MSGERLQDIGLRVSNFAQNMASVFYLDCLPSNVHFILVLFYFTYKKYNHDQIIFITVVFLISQRTINKML